MPDNEGSLFPHIDHIYDLVQKGDQVALTEAFKDPNDHLVEMMKEIELWDAMEPDESKDAALREKVKTIAQLKPDELALSQLQNTLGNCIGAYIRFLYVAYCLDFDNDDYLKNIISWVDGRRRFFNNLTLSFYSNSLYRVFSNTPTQNLMERKQQKDLLVAAEAWERDKFTRDQWAGDSYYLLFKARLNSSDKENLLASELLNDPYKHLGFGPKVLWAAKNLYTGNISEKMQGFANLKQLEESSVNEPRAFLVYFELAECYFYGRGVAQDYTKAIKYYGLAFKNIAFIDAEMYVRDECINQLIAIKTRSAFTDVAYNAYIKLIECELLMAKESQYLKSSKARKVLTHCKDLEETLTLSTKQQKTVDSLKGEAEFILGEICLNTETLQVPAYSHFESALEHGELEAGLALMKMALECEPPLLGAASSYCLHTVEKAIAAKNEKSLNVVLAKLHEIEGLDESAHDTKDNLEKIYTYYLNYQIVRTESAEKLHESLRTGFYSVGTGVTRYNIELGKADQQMIFSQLMSLFNEKDNREAGVAVLDYWLSQDEPDYEQASALCVRVYKKAVDTEERVNSPLMATLLYHAQHMYEKKDLLTEGQITRLETVIGDWINRLREQHIQNSEDKWAYCLEGLGKTHIKCPHPLFSNESVYIGTLPVNMHYLVSQLVKLPTEKITRDFKQENVRSLLDLLQKYPDGFLPVANAILLHSNCQPAQVFELYQGARAESVNPVHEQFFLQHIERLVQDGKTDGSYFRDKQDTIGINQQLSNRFRNYTRFPINEASQASMALFNTCNSMRTKRFSGVFKIKSTQRSLLEEAAKQKGSQDIELLQELGHWYLTGLGAETKQPKYASAIDTFFKLGLLGISGDQYQQEAKEQLTNIAGVSEVDATIKLRAQIALYLMSREQQNVPSEITEKINASGAIIKQLNEVFSAIKNDLHPVYQYHFLSQAKKILDLVQQKEPALSTLASEVDTSLESLKAYAPTPLETIAKLPEVSPVSLDDIMQNLPLYPVLPESPPEGSEGNYSEFGGIEIDLDLPHETPEQPPDYSTFRLPPSYSSSDSESPLPSAPPDDDLTDQPNGKQEAAMAGALASSMAPVFAPAEKTEPADSATQALEQQLQQLMAENARLQAENERVKQLEAENAELKARLEGQGQKAELSPTGVPTKAELFTLLLTLQSRVSELEAGKPSADQQQGGMSPASSSPGPKSGSSQ